MVSRHRVCIGIAALLALVIGLLPASARQAKPSASALAPMELVAEGLGHAKGIAVDGAGTVLISDWKAGRILEAGGPRIQTGAVIKRLKRPAGIAFDRERRLYIVEDGRRRLLRLEENGEMIVLASGLKDPQWLAVAGDGNAYVTARRLDSDRKDKEDRSFPEVVVRVTPEGKAAVFAGGFRGLEGVAVEQDGLAVVARGRKGERRMTGTLYEIPIEPDGRPGPVRPLAANQFLAAVGLATDRLGAHFVSAKSLAAEPWHRHVIVRVAQDGTATLFAEGLKDPEGLAFGPDGSLYLADGGSGRVFRFVALHPPSLSEVPPAVISQPYVALRLAAQAGTRLTVVGGRQPIVAAVDGGGSARVFVPLRANAENHLLVFATGAAGQGLVSAPLELSVVHDDLPPSVELPVPRVGALVRDRIVAEARAADANGIAQVEFRLDSVLVGLDAAAPYRISLDTRVVADGARTFVAIARDRAGNVARATAQVVVDNTPPSVRIARPSSGAISGPVEVLVEAEDATSGVARVEIAVDGVSRFVAEAPPYRFPLDLQGLGAGPHTLVAVALDRAGNRGESPPVSVSLAGVTVRISEPAGGARVPQGLVLVRGRVEAGGTEVGVVVNGIPAAVQGAAFAALVPVTSATRALTAVATAASGGTASDTVAISISPAPPSSVGLRASPQGGPAPLTVAFSLPGVLSAAGIELDLDGDGAVDFAGPTLDGQSFTYAQPGLYFPTATVTDTQGNRLTSSAIVRAFDPNVLDAFLQDKWNAIKAALRSGDIEGALEAVSVGIRSRYRLALQTIGADLPALAAALGDLQVVSFQDGLVEATTVRLEESQRHVYFIYFVPDDDGIWRILGM